MLISAGILRVKHFSSSCFANCQTLRIGEAANPGPTFQRNVLLEEVNLLSSKTLSLQSKIWKWFIDWLGTTMSQPAVTALLSNPITCVALIKEFGNYLYTAGKSLYVLRHLVVFVQKSRVDTKPYMSVCWEMIQKWEFLEPPVHRVPLPFGLLKAMVVLAASWKWYRFAGTICISFFGITRPGEVLHGLREDLVLPEDILNEALDKVFFRIKRPKTSRRGKGRVQHASIHMTGVAAFLRSIFGKLERKDFLYPISASSFRRRWDAILNHLSIPKSQKITPGSLRAGGAVYEYQSKGDLTHLLWRMRLQNLSTLEHYLQEVAGQTFFAELPCEARRRILLLSQLFEPFLNSFKHSEPHHGM